MLDLLNSFAKIVEKRNMTKAARELNVTQPALSLAIKRLEKRLKCKLLNRTRTGVEPTKLGRIVYQYSKRIDREVDNLENILRDKGNKDNGHIKMGMIDNVGLIFVTKIYEAFFKQYNKVKLQITVNNSNRLIQGVENGAIDFAIITDPIENLSNKFVNESFGNEELILVAIPDVARKIKTKKDLTKQNFITYNQESNTQKLILQAFSSIDISPNFTTYSSSPEFNLNITKQGLGIAILPENFVEPDIYTGDLKRIRLDNFQIKRHLDLIYLKSTYLPKITTEFIHQLGNAL